MQPDRNPAPRSLRSQGPVLRGPVSQEQLSENDQYTRILLLLKIYVELGLIHSPAVDKLEPLDE